jgi:hypothetical protein
MAYYIFLKSSRSLEEFRKNPYVKIPPKFPCTNFQILYKFKNLIFFIRKGISFSFRPSRPNRLTGLLGHLAHPTQPAFLPPPTLKQGMPLLPALRRPSFTPPWMHCQERCTASRAHFPFRFLQSIE